MKFKKVIIERLIIEEATEEEKKELIEDGYSYEGQNYYSNLIFEKCKFSD